MTLIIPDGVSIKSLVLYEIMHEWLTPNASIAFSNDVISLFNVAGDDRS